MNTRAAAGRPRFKGPRHLTGRTCLLGASLALVCPLTACCLAPFPPPSASPIAGLWEFSASANTPTSLQLLMEFDTRGDIAWVLYKVGANPTVVDQNPSGPTSVNGSSVSMNLSFGDDFFNTFVFTGTVDSAARRMTGRATLRIRESGTTINLQSVPATLDDATDIPPPGETVAGTWEYFPNGSGGPESTNLEQLLLTFDANNSPTRVIYKTTGNATVIDNLPAGSASITADAVTFQLTFLNGTGAFEGVLEPDGNLVGNITVVIGDGAVVDIRNGPAVLSPLSE